MPVYVFNVTAENAQPKRFTRLTPATWNEPDPLSVSAGLSDPERGPVKMGSGGAWAKEFLAIELSETVPADVVDLFDVAKSVLVYGWFFYPLYKTGQDQLHRAAESAAMFRFHKLRPDKPRATFDDAIRHLVKVGAIPKHDSERWHAARRLRNMGSHQHQQAAMPPAAVLGILKATKHDIDRLFAQTNELRSEL